MTIVARCEIQKSSDIKEFLWKSVPKNNWPCVYKRYNKYTVKLKLDPIKSASNKEKHGIDFTEAQVMWDDPDLLEIPAKTVDEPKYLVIGMISGKHWSGVIAYRSEKIRIISVRRSRKEEVDLYESI